MSARRSTEYMGLIAPVAPLAYPSPMGLFDIFRRKTRSPHDERAQMSRIDYLLDMKHTFLEAPHEAYDGGNFLQLVEKQLREGQTDQAIWNISNQVRDCFELANLYWGQGDVARAEAYLRQTLERHERLVDACGEYGLPRPSYPGIECAKCAACLLGVQVDSLMRDEAFEHCYEPWFKDALLSYCLGTQDFDPVVWQAAADAWTRKRHPKYRLDEFSFYVKALTGGFESTGAMFAAHEKLVAGRAKRNPASGLLDGYDDNELIIDYIFAAVLDRIGWQGTYRHSWPHTDVVGSVPQTTRQPDRYLRVLAASAPAVDAPTGIIDDVQKARRYIDRHVAEQTDYDGEPLAADRSARERGKVAPELKALGWTGDEASLDLMQRYRMDLILNDRTALSLCDPVNRSSVKLANWTRLFVDDFGLHPDFIAIAGSEEPTDYLDPQGGWYVRWKKDGRIYSVQRDDWGDPGVATADARPGLNLWPSYTSFVAWWVTEHVRSKG